MQNISRLLKQVILSYSTLLYFAYLYIAEKEIWQLLQALGNSTKTGDATQMCAAFKLNLCVPFLIIAIMLSDYAQWYISLTISDLH